MQPYQRMQPYQVLEPVCYQMREPAYCAKRKHLAEAFSTSARLYAEAVVALTRSSAQPLSERDYRILRRKVRQAHQQASNMMAMFEDHLAFHQCFEGACGNGSRSYR